VKQGSGWTRYRRNPEYQTNRWKELAREVTTGKACELCGKPARAADHLIPASVRPDLFYDKANLRLAEPLNAPISGSLTCPGRSLTGWSDALGTAPRPDCPHRLPRAGRHSGSGVGGPDGNGPIDRRRPPEDDPFRALHGFRCHACDPGIATAHLSEFSGASRGPPPRVRHSVRIAPAALILPVIL
jgi:hypothetical protein